jgi:tetratricopeptide (TPR) repeat protein
LKEQPLIVAPGVIEAAVAHIGVLSESIRLFNRQLKEAHRQHGKGEHDRAIADYSKSIGLDPKFVRAYNNRGIAYDSKGEHDHAIADFSKAIELDPNSATGYNNRAWAYFKAGKAADGLHDAQRALELLPDKRPFSTQGEASSRLWDAGKKPLRTSAVRSRKTRTSRIARMA